MGDVVEGNFKKKVADDSTFTATQVICADCHGEDFGWYIQVPYIYMHCSHCGSGYRAGVPLNVLAVMSIPQEENDGDKE